LLDSVASSLSLGADEIWLHYFFHFAAAAVQPLPLWDVETKVRFLYQMNAGIFVFVSLTSATVAQLTATGIHPEVLAGCFNVNAPCIVESRIAAGQQAWISTDNACNVFMALSQILVPDIGTHIA